jgi:hypothetical protein
VKCNLLLILKIIILKGMECLLILILSLRMLFDSFQRSHWNSWGSIDGGEVRQINLYIPPLFLWLLWKLSKNIGRVRTKMSNICQHTSPLPFAQFCNLSKKKKENIYPIRKLLVINVPTAGILIIQSLTDKSLSLSWMCH